MHPAFLLVLSAFFLSSAQPEKDVAAYVDPMIGTDGMGHTFPGACAPFGIVQLSPDTDTIPHNVGGKYQKKAYEYCAGYRYGDRTIVGFSHTHLSGTGHSDLGDILLMPQTGSLRLNPGTAGDPDSGYRSRFSHEREKAEAGCYEVYLDDPKVQVRLTATPRTGIHEYTYAPGEEQRVILDLLHGIYNYDGKVLWSSLRVENDTLVTGYRITSGWARCNYTYFAVSFSKPVTEYGYQDRKQPAYKGFWRKFDIHHNFPEIAGRDVTAYFGFAPSGEDGTGRTLVVKVALSAVSTEGALENLRAEASGRTFDEIRAATRESWNRELGVLQCTGTEAEKTLLYTSFYHTMINPSVYQDVDGCYRGLDGNIHRAEGFTNYTVFSLWDTYRAEHPFLGLVKESRNTDMVRSMVAHQRQSVHHMLPVWSLMGNEGWCMTGYHAVTVLADALVKGADLDADEVLKAMVETAECPYYESLPYYMKLGYAPFDKSSTAASNTLEYALDDWTVHAAARKAGREDIAAEFARRAAFWRNTFDPRTGFATPRYSDGTFKPDPDPFQTYGEGFIEGNAWNFSFHVPQDVEGLIRMMGGDRRFIARLDSLFSMDLPEVYYKDNEDITADCLVGGYVHGNEPSHHVPYLYAWTSEPWKTQHWVRTIMDKMYRNRIRGLGGNDDCGQMSAWYLFTALGFYPVCPGTGEYVLGAPYLPYLDLELENGNHIVVKAPGVSDRKRYVRRVRIDGKPYDKRFVTDAMLRAGCTLEFEMSERPSRTRGLAGRPYSLSSGEVK